MDAKTICSCLIIGLCIISGIPLVAALAYLVFEYVRGALLRRRMERDLKWLQHKTVNYKDLEESSDPRNLIAGAILKALEEQRK